MLYPINKVEKILGVSQSTIRRYVDAGIIRARRSEDSAYRYFSVKDIAEMGVYLGMRAGVSAPSDYPVESRADRPDRFCTASSEGDRRKNRTAEG